MDDTRAKLRVLVTSLRSKKVTQKDLCDLAGWSQAYMSGVVGERGSKDPSPAKVADLLRAIHHYLPELGGVPPHDLEVLSDRYDVSLQTPRAPTEPIAPTDVNYVAREDLVQSISTSVSIPGSYGIDGPPMSGRTSALLLVRHHLIRSGYEVCLCSCRDDLLNLIARENNETGVVGAIASQMLSRSDVVAYDHFELEDEIAQFLQRQPDGFGLLLDDLDALDDRSVRRLDRMLRSWQSKRAAGTPGFKKTTVWVSKTSYTTRATRESLFLPDLKILRWFRREEVRELAAALARTPIATSDDAGRSFAQKVRGRDDIVDAVSAAAMRHFEGQPWLTHHFLFQWRLGAIEDLASEPHGVLYERHVGRLATAVLERAGDDGVRAILEAVGSREPAVGSGEPGVGSGEPAVGSGEPLPRHLNELAVIALRVCNVDGKGTLSWSCPFYDRYLPDALRLRVDEAANTRDS